MKLTLVMKLNMVNWGKEKLLLIFDCTYNVCIKPQKCNYFIIYSPLCHYKPVCVFFLQYTKMIFWTKSVRLIQCCFGPRWPPLYGLISWNILQNIFTLCCRSKKDIQVWNDMRVSIWLQQGRRIRGGGDDARDVSLPISSHYQNVPNCPKNVPKYVYVFVISDASETSYHWYYLTR